MSKAAYFDAFKNIVMERTESGVLTVRFHTDGGPLNFNAEFHSDLPRALEAIADDRDNRVLVLTGTGDRFITEIDAVSMGELFKPLEWDRIYTEGRRIMQRLVDLEMPIVSAVNGPASVHCEIALLGDVIVTADTTEFSDFPHLGYNVLPGDGIQVVWEEVLGFNRYRHLTVTQGSFTAQQALDWGVVAEVTPLGKVLPRAQEIAEKLAVRPKLLNRYLSVTLRQRLSRRMAEGTALGLALEGLTLADQAYQQQA